MSGPARVKVWDPFVRIFHWTVVAAFFIAYFTEDELLALHVWAGYTIGALVMLRVVWGFVGPRHARFGEFICGPVRSWRYFVDLVAFRAERHLGHSPAGGVMVLLLLVGLVATVWSGLEFYAVEENAGPLAELPTLDERSRAWLPVLDARANGSRESNDREREREEHNKREEADKQSRGFWKEVHEALANLVLILVVMHVAGVVLASVVHRENLVKSMLDGYKRSD